MSVYSVEKSTWLRASVQTCHYSCFFEGFFGIRVIEHWPSLAVVMDLLFGDDVLKHATAEELVLELLNCSFFLYSEMSGKWIRQTPGDLNRVLIYRNKKR